MQTIRKLTRRKFVRDTAILQVSKIGVTVLGLVAWVIVPVAMGTGAYGTWTLVQSFLTIWLTLDFTGLSVSISTLMGEAVGGRNSDEILHLMSVYVKASIAWAVFTLAVLLLLGGPLAALIYGEPLSSMSGGLELYSTVHWADGSGRIGVLAALLSLSLFFDPLYNLALIALQSRRLMGKVALLQNLNQLVLTICLVAAALLHPKPEALVLARVAYSALTMLIAVIIYERQRSQTDVTFPSFWWAVAAGWRAPYRRYWRFGVAAAVDKNLAVLYTQIPIQLAGIAGGAAAAGYLQLALRGIGQASIFTSAIFDNMQAVVPQAVGRGDFERLKRNFLRVLVVLVIGGAIFYGAFALFAPVFLVPIFGDEWRPVLPLLLILAIYGVVTTAGGIFGPLYRAFHLLRSAIIVKVIALLAVLPFALLVEQSPVEGSAWLVNGFFVVSVLLTAAVTLPVLYRRAVNE